MDNSELKEYLFSKLLPYNSKTNEVSLNFKHGIVDATMSAEEKEYRYIISLVCDILEEYENFKNQK